MSVFPLIRHPPVYVSINSTQSAPIQENNGQTGAEECHDVKQSGVSSCKSFISISRFLRMNYSTDTTNQQRKEDLCIYKSL